MTEEQRKRISKSLKGRIPKNIELLHKKAIKFRTGQIPWNKNMKVDRTKFPSMGHFKKNSEEIKRKISEATRKAMANPEIRKKLSESHKGKPSAMKGKKTGKPSWIKGKHHTEETRRKMKEAINKRWLNPEYRKRMSIVHKGQPSAMKRKHPSPETLKKLSESHKGKPSARRGAKLSEEERKKVSEATKRAMANPEIKEKFLKANIKRYLDPISLEKIKETSRKTLLGLYESGAFPKQTDTKPERDVRAELTKRGYKEGIDFIHQYRFMNKFMCDFCFSRQRVIVEVYGDFWHANPNRYPEGSILHKHQLKDIARDKSKEAYITTVDNRSWTYIFLWENDIKKDVSKCVDRIEEVLTKKQKI